MYDDLFVKNKFVFIQYSDTTYQNIMFGEYAVPAHYQKLKANGVGALMIYGFFCTASSGRTLSSYVRQMRQPINSRIPKEKTYIWLTEHQFPDAISEWFSKNLQKGGFNQNKATNAKRG
ncbi:MAG: hypothetical protein LV480_03760 [Methylacidiphilales bacterium]|nr:hypothetical protein [Candidatus Methylacidiphilales bacterium]